MKKSVYIRLAGRDYPLNFSLGACKVITKELGSLENIEKTLAEKFDVDTIDKISTILCTLIAQGCVYKNLFEIDPGTYDVDEAENPALGEDGRFKVLKKDELEVALGFEDIGEIITKIGECVGASSVTEVEAKKPKNEKPPEEA